MSAPFGSPERGDRILVLGVGNLLWADEGFGVRAVEAFAQSYGVPDHVDLVDGGTQGLALVNQMAEASRILIFDAVDADMEPADLVIVRGEDVPKFAAGKKVSLHSIARRIKPIAGTGNLHVDCFTEHVVITHVLHQVTFDDFYTFFQCNVFRRDNR